MDIWHKEKRSKVMSLIKSKHTKPEIIVRKYLFAKKIRYRVNVINLPGKPDIAIKKYKVAIFINGCFWHGHDNCKIAHLPKTRTEWWKVKIERNKERDRNVRNIYKEMGWHAITIWECELSKKDSQTKRLESLVLEMNSIKGK